MGGEHARRATRGPSPHPIACRRVLLGRWWEAQDALFRRGRIAGAAAAGRANLFGGASPRKPSAEAAARAAAKGGRGSAGGSPAKATPPLRSGEHGIKAVRAAGAGGADSRR